METSYDREACLFGLSLIQFFVGILLFIALLYTQKALILLSVFVLSLMLLARIWSRLGLSGVDCHAWVDKDRLFPGERFTLQFRVQNAKLLPVWLQIRIGPEPPLKLDPPETALVKESGLLGYQSVRHRWELAAQRRGVYRVGRPRLRIGDYLGFFPREKEIAQSPQIIVYPKLIPLKPFSLPRRDFFGVPGTKSPVWDPIYVLGTRDYQHNQPARYIHWKASAHHGRLQGKVFEPSAQEKVLLVLDVDQFSGNGASDEFERMLEVMASLGVALNRQGYSLGLATNGALTGGGPGLLPVARTPRHLSAFLEILARVQMVRNADLIDTLGRGLRSTWGISCVHFSYQVDAAMLAVETYFRVRRSPALFMVCRHPSRQTGLAHRLQSRICALEDIRAAGVRHDVD